MTPTAVQVDTSLFSGPTMAPGWDPADIDGGDIAPIESVMLDGGRIQPATVDSRRSVTPALDAGRALAIALGVDPQHGHGAAPRRPAAGRLASVQSPPLIERLRQMMNDSDNVMAESHRAVRWPPRCNRPQSFDGAVDAVTNRLSTAHVDTGGATLLDSSGLSVDDRLTAKTLDGVVQAAAGPDQPTLRPLLDLLPIAGGSGTLSDRFLDTDTGRGGRRLAAGQDRIADRNQRAGRRRDRPQRAGADVRVHLQRRRADRPHGDRRAGRHAAVVRVRHVSAAAGPDRRPHRRLEIRGDGRPGWPGPGPPSTDYTRSQVIDELAEPRPRKAEPPVRDVTGLHTDGADSRGPHRRPCRVDPRGNRVDAGDDRRHREAARRFITGRVTGAQTGAVLAFVSSGILGQYDPFGPNGG